MFHTSVLRPKGGAKFCEISQKILSATACRYLIFWVYALLQQVNTNDLAGQRLDTSDETFVRFSSFSQVGKWVTCKAIIFESVEPVSLRWRAGLIGALATMESVMLNNGRWLDSDGARSFECAYLMFRACLNNLACRAIERDEVKYHQRPKLHQLGHLVYHFLPRNPRYFANYSDEDAVARSKRLAIIAHPAHTSRLTLQRYIIQVCLRYSDGMV